MKTLQMTIMWAIIPLLTWAQVPQSSLSTHSYRSDSVVISGHILNRTFHAIPYVALNHFITGESVKITIPLDSLGRFCVKVPAFNTTRIYLNYVAKGNTLFLLAEPGEKIIIQVDWKDNRVTFEGDNAKIHQDVFNYHSYLETISRSYIEFVPEEKLSHDQYLQKLKRFASRQDSILNNYIKQHPELCERAKQEMRMENYDALASPLMQRRFDLDRTNGEKFSQMYMEYADSVFAALPKPYTAVNTTFLRDYLNYYGETRQMPSAFRLAVVDYAIKEKRIVPNEEQLKNPVLILQAKEFQPILGAIYNELKQKESFVRVMLDYYNGGALIVPMDSELKEIVTTQAFYKYLMDERTALSDGNVNYFKQQVKSPALQKFVLDYQHKLSAMENNRLDFAESLKDATPFKDCKTGEELFHRLIAPHQGKIIYLDVWGTWCPPCKQEMKYVGAIKEAMKGKDIVFLYLANNSTEVAWKNIIKENRLTGKQVEHYNLPSDWQQMVEEYLEIRSYPTYHIISREGTIIEKRPLRPSSGKQLIDYLNELLSK